MSERTCPHNRPAWMTSPCDACIADADRVARNEASIRAKLAKTYGARRAKRLTDATALATVQVAAINAAHDLLVDRVGPDEIEVSDGAGVAIEYAPNGDARGAWVDCKVWVAL